MQRIIQTNYRMARFIMFVEPERWHLSFHVFDSYIFLLARAVSRYKLNPSYHRVTIALQKGGYYGEDNYCSGTN